MHWIVNIPETVNYTNYIQVYQQVQRMLNLKQTPIKQLLKDKEKNSVKRYQVFNLCTQWLFQIFYVKCVKNQEGLGPVHPSSVWILYLSHRIEWGE